MEVALLPEYESGSLYGMSGSQFRTKWLSASGIFNHVGIVLKVGGNNITIQDGNYDGITNTFEDAKKDWQTNTYTFDYYRLRMGGIVFANPK